MQLRAASGVGNRLAGQCNSGFAMASHARCCALVLLASARSMVACDETTSQRWALP